MKGRPFQSAVGIVVVSLWVALLPTPASAVGRGKARYVGGTIAGLEANVEAPVDLADGKHFVFKPRGTPIRFPWDAVAAVGYRASGMKGETRAVLGVLFWPSLFFTKGRTHHVTIEFEDGTGRHQVATFEFDKNDVRTVLSVIKLRTGKPILCEGEEVGNPIEACYGPGPREVVAQVTEPAPLPATAPAAGPTTAPASGPDAIRPEPVPAAPAAVVVPAAPKPLAAVTGPRVRIVAPSVSSRSFEGELVESDETTLTIRCTHGDLVGRTYGATLKLPRESVTSFERSVRPSRKASGAAVGFVVGLLVGYSTLCGFDSECGDDPGLALGLLGVLALPAAGLGAGVAPGERWVAEDPRDTRKVRVGLVPTVGRGVGAALSFGF